MSQLRLLRAASTLADLAVVLGVKASALSFLLYLTPDSAKYASFEIAKRSGGRRTINAPTAKLKGLQKKLSELLQNCWAEIVAAESLRDELAHGFKRSHSIITNAQVHRNRRFVLNIDVSNFFESIHFGRVYGFFTKNKFFQLKPKVALVIAQIACFERRLPQGSPCSPVISNLIANIVDVHLSRLATACNCSYSRYADDITFSTNEVTFPKRLAVCNAGAWEVSAELDQKIRQAGFEVNGAKTRLQFSNFRQEVTGLVVNQKVNVPNEYRRKVRAMVHRLVTTGEYQLEVKVQPGASMTTSVTGTAGKLQQLHGMLAFIDQVDLLNNKNLLNNKRSAQRQISSKESMYRRFLFYKEFYASSRPVILCEGKTDNVYLTHAIRSLVTAYPSLATLDGNGDVKIAVRRFRYPGTSTGRILGINGGSGDLNGFISNYLAEVMRFKAPPPAHPTVVLIDNDAGAESVYNTVRQINKTKPTGKEDFIWVRHNLYVVATPLLGRSASMIEDFFQAPLLATVVNGKTFKADKPDEKSEYGKAIFAYKVVAQNAPTIDFSGFRPLLDRIAAVIEDYRLRI